MPPKSASEHFRIVAGALALAEARASVSFTQL